MHKLSSIISKPIFSLFEGLWLGTILDVCFKNGKISGFFILSSDEENFGFISKKDIHKIGDDAVVVKNLSKLSTANCERLNLINKKALTLEGEDLGKIVEIFLDNNLNMLSLETSYGIIIPSNKILNVGQDAVIFNLLENKIKISSFKPKGNLFKNDLGDITVSIMKEETGTMLATIGEVEDLKEKPTVPKKIMQNPNFLIGRIVSNTIMSSGGEMIIKEGQRITEKVIAKAKINNKIYELSAFAN